MCPPAASVTFLPIFALTRSHSTAFFNLLVPWLLVSHVSLLCRDDDGGEAAWHERSVKAWDVLHISQACVIPADLLQPLSPVCSLTQIGTSTRSAAANIPTIGGQQSDLVFTKVIVSFASFQLMSACIYYNKINKEKHSLKRVLIKWRFRWFLPQFLKLFM